MNEFFKKPVVKILMLKGEKGDKGNTGTGTPTGGKTGQYLLKKSDADYDYVWSPITTVSWDNVSGKPDATASASGLMSAADKAKLDNLQIGGRNLLLNSASYDDTEVVPYSAPNTQSVNVTPGEKITVSFDVKAKEPHTRKNIAIMQYYDSSGNRIEEYGLWITGNIKTEYTRISLTDTVKDNVVSFKLGLRSPDGYAITYAKIKIERGTVATDWTPAPEDVDSKIDALNSVTKNFTLSASSYTDSGDHWFYDVSDALITATSNQEIIPSTTIVPDQLKALQKANLVCDSQIAGHFYLRVFGTKPTIDIPITIIFRGNK